MNQRQQDLLNLIISQYIKSAQPVGSNLITDLIAKSGGFFVSPATIRNEMAKLEESGFLSHPHTSAGRIPTEIGYRYYIENFLRDCKLTKKKKDSLTQVMKKFKKSPSDLLRNLAKMIADLSEEMVLIGFSRNNFYYTGLANLFSQPEFSNLGLVCQISQIVDHLDEVIGDIFPEIDEQIKILIGKENPFGKDCGSILTKYKFKRDKGLLGILGPMRMNYSNNLALMKYAKIIISN